MISFQGEDADGTHDEDLPQELAATGTPTGNLKVLLMLKLQKFDHILSNFVY